MDTYNEHIILKKENDDGNFLMSMFSILSKEASDKEIIFEGNKVIVRQRNANEITKLSTSIDDLKNKIFAWLENKTLSAPLVLTIEESKLLQYFASAAYYFLTEKNDVLSQSHQFIKFYKKNFT